MEGSLPRPQNRPTRFSVDIPPRFPYNLHGVTIMKYKSLFVFICLLMMCRALADAPVYQGAATCQINDGVPSFAEDEITAEPFIHYDPIDKWQRASKATACLGPETLALSGRAAMQSIEPSGWQPASYDFIPGYNLYQRCHLIGDQLGGEEIAENLVTGTQYLNISGMLPVENRIAEYITRTSHHVMYRVWPYYRTGDLLCLGVQIEALSVEDDEISINLYAFNAQPGVHIDYRTGDSSLAAAETQLEYQEQSEADQASHVMSDQLTYVLNTNTKKFHLPTCSSVKEMKPKNKQESTLSRDDLIAKGYAPCKRCNP